MAGSRSPNPPPSPSSSSSSISTPPEQLKVSQEKLEALAEARKEEEKEGRVVLGHEGAEEEEELPPGRSRCRWLDITIEPALFIGMFGAMLMSLIMQNLMLDKTCRVNLDYSGKSCKKISILGLV